MITLKKLINVQYLKSKKNLELFGNPKNCFWLFGHPKKYFGFLGHPKKIIFDFLDTLKNYLGFLGTLKNISDFLDTSKNYFGFLDLLKTPSTGIVGYTIIRYFTHEQSLNTRYYYVSLLLTRCNSPANHKKAWMHFKSISVWPQELHFYKSRSTSIQTLYKSFPSGRCSIQKCRYSHELAIWKKVKHSV